MRIENRALRVENLYKRYGGQETLRGVNLNIARGEFYALMGPNGSGKTTLASIIATVKSPTSGKIEIFGKPPEEAKNEKLIGYVPQENFSSPLLTGRENLLYFSGLMGYNRREAKQLVDSLLAKMGLGLEGNKKVSKYSGGMRKKLEIATAFFPGIKLLILDEPTTGLDPAARRELFSLLQELRERANEDIALMLITHIGSDAELADRVGLMADGKIIAEGTPDGLKKGILKAINLETSLKSKKILDLLESFSQEEVMETEAGYRIYSEKPELITPELVKALDSIGCKTEKIELVSPTLEDVFFKLTGRLMKEVS